MKKGPKVVLTPEQELELIQKELGHLTLDNLPVFWLNTGSPKLNSVLGSKDMGLPYGKVYELFGLESNGKTLLSLFLAGKAQRDGAIVAWVDFESSFDDAWAKKQGLDPTLVRKFRLKIGRFPTAVKTQFGTKIVVSKEPRLQTAQELCKEVETWMKYQYGIGVQKLYICVDSVTAMLVEEEDRAGLTNQNMKTGVALATFLSKLLRRWVGYSLNYNAMIVFINQLRMAPGKKFGCFSENTRVTMADGSTKRIHTIVRKKSNQPVLSFDKKTKKFVSKEVTNWFSNGRMTEDWYLLTVQSTGGRGGRMRLTVTGNHTVMKGSGNEAKVKDLLVGDKLISWYIQRVGDVGLRRDILYGTMLGDGWLENFKPDTHAFTSRLGLKNSVQLKYLRWKLNKLSFLGDFTYANGGYFSKRDFELGLIKNRFYRNGVQSRKYCSYRCIPDDLLELTPIMAAIWYMDDGHYRKDDYNYKYSKHYERCIGLIGFKRLTTKDRIRAVELLQNFVGVGVVSMLSEGGARLNRVAFLEFCNKIHKFVPVCMQYKLPVEFRNKYEEFSVPEFLDRKFIATPLVDIERVSPKKYKNKEKFDLQIADCGYYLVGGCGRGIVVHNSPEYTTGGNALKYYASIRARVGRARTGRVLQQGKIIGLRALITNMKNKSGAASLEGQSCGFQCNFDRYRWEFFTKQAIMEKEKE